MTLEMLGQSVSVLRFAEKFPEIARATLSCLRGKRKKPLVNEKQLSYEQLLEALP